MHRAPAVLRYHSPMPSDPPRLTRRQALALIAAAVGAPALAAAPAGEASVLEPAVLRRTFFAFCDTLVPADEHTPAASALGVPERILGEAGGHELYSRLVALSCAWLDEEADGDFAGKAEASRNAILERMAGLPWQAPQRRFFSLMRNLVMGYYYAHPVAAAALGFDRPPQPLGFRASVE